MNNLKNNLSDNNIFNKRFSHIYYEERALSYDTAKRILDFFPDSKRIPLRHYKDFFSRTGQDFVLQKKSQKIILAVKEDNFLYQWSSMCQIYSDINYYYTSLVINCPYDCHYCFLQGMYPSSNIVVFVNNNDFFDAALKKLSEGPLYVAISYDTDLLPLEQLTGYCSQWINFTRTHQGLTTELRTKSAAFNLISMAEPCDNFILAWTVSPPYVVENYELGTPSFKARLDAIIKAIDRGWKVRLCFDPVIMFENAYEYYSKMIDEIFSVIPVNAIYDITAGVFRMPADFLKRIRKARPYSEFSVYPFVLKNGTYSYNEISENMIMNRLLIKISQYIKKEKIFIHSLSIS